MSDKNIIAPFPKKILNHGQQDQLQNRLFAELDSKGLLRVKSIGATITIWVDSLPKARVIYHKAEDAKTVAESMMAFFQTNNMVNWAATVDTLEIF